MRGGGGDGGKAGGCSVHAQMKTDTVKRRSTAEGFMKIRPAWTHRLSLNPPAGRGEPEKLTPQNIHKNYPHRQRERADKNDVG